MVVARITGWESSVQNGSGSQAVCRGDHTGEPMSSSIEPKIGMVMLHQESNTFNPRLTSFPDLDVTWGSAVVERWRGTGMPIGGALGVFEQTGYEVVGLGAASGASGGPLAAETVNSFSRDLRSR